VSTGACRWSIRKILKINDKILFHELQGIMFRFVTLKAIIPKWNWAGRNHSAQLPVIAPENGARRQAEGQWARRACGDSILGHRRFCLSSDRVELRTNRNARWREPVSEAGTGVKKEEESEMKQMEMVRAAGRAAICGLVCLLMAMGLWTSDVSAQGVRTTTVQGTVYLANGQPGAGTLTVRWPAFTTATARR